VRNKKSISEKIFNLWTLVKILGGFLRLSEANLRIGSKFGG